MVLPTETLYALAADATNPGAVDRVLELKRRPPESPIALIIPDWQAMIPLAWPPPPLCLELLKAHWPGPLTAVLQARGRLHPALVSEDGGVGMRISPHPVAGGVARALGRPLTATSANISGHPPPAQPNDLHPEIINGVDLVIDAGPCPGGPPSTVADLRAWPPRVLRPGAVKL